MIDPAKANHAFQKLDQSLTPLWKHPTPRQIHKLRTRTRRVEALLDALMLDRQRDGKLLRKSLTPIRKKAGRVRDADVLIGFAATLSSSGEEECLIRLLEHLGRVRDKSVRKLRDTFSAHRKEARALLRQCADSVGGQLAVSRRDDAAARERSAESTAAAITLWSEFSEWPRLTDANLHSFRLKVKELRYILQLAPDGDTELVKILGQVKDASGAWHDWNELAGIAAGTLDHGSRCAILKQIRSTTQTKLEEALAAAKSMRNKYRANDESGLPRQFPSEIERPG